MTSPAGEPQPSQPNEDTTVAALAALLVLVPVPTGRIVLLLRSHGIPPRAARAATQLATSQPIVPNLPIGQATRATIRQNALRRGQYLLAAAKRITRSIGTDTTAAALLLAVRQEYRYLRQHIEAGQNRILRAAAVDSAAYQYGPLLGWHAVMDDRTSAECRDAHGANFYADRVPPIGWPGSVHPHCRCHAVAPYATRRLVGGGVLPEPGVVAAASRHHSIDLSRR